MIRAKSDERPAPIAANLPEGQTFISSGKEYEVHAMAVFQDRLHVQIVDDLRMIRWYPAWFFETFDTSVPTDWICSMFNGEPSMVVGPRFLAESISSYNSMVELEDDLVQQFWRRLDSQKKEEY
jgi:hypothetical protein